MIQPTQLYNLLKYHNCLEIGRCESDGYYVPVGDAIEGDFETNKIYYREGDDFETDDEHIRVPE